MNRRLQFALFLLIAVWSGRLAAQDVSRPQIHRVQLAVQPGDDAAAVAKAVAARYGGRLEAPVASDDTVAMTIDDSVLELLQRDPRVQWVDDPVESPEATLQPAASGRVLSAVATRPVQTDSTATPWTTGTYAYDAAGNITQMGNDQFVYDVYSRVRSGTAASQSQAYTYDRYGNLKSITAGSITLPLTVETATNRLTAFNGNSIVYDDAGQVWKVNNSTFYTYDGSGMMTSIGTSQTTPSNLYLYTASDERIATVYLSNGVEASSTWSFRDASGKVLRRFDKLKESNQWTWVWRQDYIYNGSQMLASENDTPPKTRHYFTDHLGSPRLITDDGGMQIGRADYFPFGAEALAWGVDDSKQFTGHERDASGLDYMHARYYSWGWGRFLSVDPTWESAGLGKPQSWNRYSYVLNNPINYTDPDGRVCSAAVVDCVLTGTSVGGPVGAVVGTVVGVGIVYGGSRVNWRAVGEWLVSGGGSSGEVAAERLAQNMANHMSERYAPKDENGNPRPLPTKDGNDTPDPAAEGRPHTQLGTRPNPTKGEAPYPQSRTWDGNGQGGRRIDNTDHNDPKNHPNPHQHRIDPNGKKHGPEPVPEIPPKDPKDK